MHNFSIIIPTLNESEMLDSTLKHLRAIERDVQVIVADGGSEDNTLKIAKKYGAECCSSEKGRGIQCNVGTQKANGEIFVFLHADTLLPPDAFIQLANSFQDPQVQVGTFRMRFDVQHWLLDAYSFFTRFDSIWTTFGDQVLVVRKDFFEELGGFPSWPLFEDVHFMRLARRRVRIYSFPGPVMTASRKFMKNGLIKQQLQNGYLILQYLLGVSPDKLARQYRR